MADQQYRYIFIQPCATLDDGAGNDVPGMFHLLTCGHVIAVDDENRRCGRNCAQAVTWAVAHASISKKGQKTSRVIKAHLPPLGPMQAHDTLYCETCSGIPIDRWQRMNPTNPPEALRRCLALTRLVIQTAFGIDELQARTLPCSPYFDPRQDGFDWNQVHRLRCGHEICTALVRPCATNCVDDPPCYIANLTGHERQNDAILCQECVYRAELLFHRWARVGNAIQSNRDSGHTSADPHLTGDYGDY